MRALSEVRAALVSILSVGADPAGDQQAAAGNPPFAERLRRLEAVDLASVVDALRLLDPKQLRGLVEDLDAALRDEVPARRGRIKVAAAGNVIGGEPATARDEEGKKPESERSAPTRAPLQVNPSPPQPTAPTPAPLQVKPSPPQPTAPTLAPPQVKPSSPQPRAYVATSTGRETRITVRSRSRRRPRRVLVALASAFLAMIFISFLFVSAADPPPESAAVAIKTSHTAPTMPPGHEAATVRRSSGDLASSSESLRQPAASSQAGPGTENSAAVDPIPPPLARNKSEPGAIAPPSPRHEATTGADPGPSVSPSNDTQPKPGPLTALRSADTAEQASHPKPIAPQSKAEAKPPPQAPTPDASASEPDKSQSPEMVPTLLYRADYLLLQRDVAGARMFYERAAGAGSIVAASGVARTYDPLFLRWIGAVGIRGDKAKAIYWYRKASEGGDRASAERLTMLLSDRSE